MKLNCNLVLLLLLSLQNSNDFAFGTSVQSGQLTAGDVDDNLNFEFYNEYKDRTASSSQVLPNLPLTDRVSIRVKDVNGDPFSCAIVTVENLEGENKELPAGSNGRLYIYPTLEKYSPDPAAWNIQARPPECVTDCNSSGPPSDTTRSAIEDLQLQINEQSSLPDKLDVALIVDTTGSMCDELNYLQEEIRSVLQNVLGSPNLASRTVDVQVSLVLYKDEGDIPYVVRSIDFAPVDVTLESFLPEVCSGGGDYPEAMDQAVSAATKLNWRSGNTARIAFLVADAPPHDENFVASLNAALELKTKGVRLYGLAASGVGNTAEYIMRMMALITGARYMWLTDDSGIGNSHAEPKVLCYHVTRLDQLMGRVIESELVGYRIEPDPSHIIREVGSQEAGVCLFEVDELDDEPDDEPEVPDPDIPTDIGGDGDSGAVLYSDSAGDKAASAPSPEGGRTTAEEGAGGGDGGTGSPAGGDDGGTGSPPFADDFESFPYGSSSSVLTVSHWLLLVMALIIKFASWEY